jgi:hypothetical protein
MTNRKQDRVTITLPNQKQWRIGPGRSSLISKAVIEEFGPRFLIEPMVVLLSESRRKTVGNSAVLAKEAGLKIPPDWLLPDVILAELRTVDPFLVFVDVVADEGPISESRRLALSRLTTDAGFPPQQIAFVTALMDRGGGDFRRVCSEIAWGTFVWISTEPDNIIAYFGKGQPRRLCDMAHRGARREAIEKRQFQAHPSHADDRSAGCRD